MRYPQIVSVSSSTKFYMFKDLIYITHFIPRYLKRYKKECIFYQSHDFIYGLKS